MKLIDWKIMMKFIRSLGMESIPQSVFYSRIHEQRKEWSVEQISWKYEDDYEDEAEEKISDKFRELMK